MIVKREHRRFFHADAPSPHSPLGQRGRRELRGALIFLPDAYVGREAELLAKAPLFKRGANYNRIAFLRNQQAQQALAGPPVHSGEVIERSSGGDKQRIELWILLREQLLSAR